MNKLIIVCGLPGSGKTTLAQELSRKTNIVCLYKDEMKENLYDELGMKNLEDSKRIGAISMKILYKQMERIMKNKVDLIVEAPFSFEEDFDYINDLGNKHKTKVFVIVCEVEEIERKKRFRNRDRHPSHHDKERDFEYKKVNYNKLAGKKIYINTNLSSSSLVNKILKEI